VENGAGLARGHVMLWAAERTDQANLPNQGLAGWRWTLLAIKTMVMEWLDRGSKSARWPMDERDATYLNSALTSIDQPIREVAAELNGSKGTCLRG
jgi:hypothetical protein